METEGDGSFCLSGPNVNKTVSDAWLAENGKGTYKVLGWINARAEMEDGVFYGVSLTSGCWRVEAYTNSVLLLL